MKKFFGCILFFLVITSVCFSFVSVYSQELAAHEFNGDDIALSFDDIEYKKPNYGQNNEVDSSSVNNHGDNDPGHFIHSSDKYDAASIDNIITDSNNVADVDSSSPHNHHSRKVAEEEEENHNDIILSENLQVVNSDNIDMSGDTGHSYVWMADNDSDTDDATENIWYGDPTQIPECVLSTDSTIVENENDEVELDTTSTIIEEDKNEVVRNNDVINRDSNINNNNNNNHSNFKINMHQGEESKNMNEEGKTHISITSDGSVDINDIDKTITATRIEELNISQQQHHQQQPQHNEVDGLVASSIINNEMIDNIEYHMSSSSNTNDHFKLHNIPALENEMQPPPQQQGGRAGGGEDDENISLSKALKQEEGEVVEGMVDVNGSTNERNPIDDHTATAALLEQQREKEESEQQALFEMLAVQAELAQESYDQSQQELLDESVAEAAEHAAQEIERMEHLAKAKEMEMKRKEKQQQQQQQSSSSGGINQQDKSWHSGLTSRISGKLRQFGTPSSSSSQHSSQLQAGGGGGFGLGSSSSQSRMSSGNNNQFDYIGSNGRNTGGVGGGGVGVGGGKSSSSGSHSSLEALINKSAGGSSGGSIQEKIQQAKAISLQQQKEKAERYKRYKIPRQYARIVEQIITTYNNPQTTLYEVLGVTTTRSSGANMVVSGKSVRDTRVIHDDDIRRAYRHMVFAVHPDRNPHPDAEKAFDYIQEAYEELINHNNRKTYDYSLFKQNQRKKIWGNWNKLKKVLQEKYVNFKARALLFIFRVFRGNQETRKEEYQELIGNRLIELSIDFRHYLEKIILVPERKDRICLVNELYSDYWKQVVGISFLITLCLLPSF